MTTRLAYLTLAGVLASSSAPALADAKPAAPSKSTSKAVAAQLSGALALDPKLAAAFSGLKPGADATLVPAARQQRPGGCTPAAAQPKAAPTAGQVSKPPPAKAPFSLFKRLGALATWIAKAPGKPKAKPGKAAPQPKQSLSAQALAAHKAAGTGPYATKTSYKAWKPK